VNDEPFLTRAQSVATGTRTQDFRNAVRDRDRRCVISKEVNDEYFDPDSWAGFEAAHIFPLAYEHQWLQENYSRWITMVPPQGGSINSVQNGLLMFTGLHSLFDQYIFSINPDVRYLLCHAVLRPF
jgi:hypothetical protein